MISMYLLPDFPLTTRWLTEAERQLAHDRIQRDTVGMAPSKGAKAGFIQAIRDPRLYVLCFMQNMVSLISHAEWFRSWLTDTTVAPERVQLQQLLPNRGEESRL
jgi:hypothetical protein